MLNIKNTLGKDTVLSKVELFIKLYIRTRVKPLVDSASQSNLYTVRVKEIFDVYRLRDDAQEIVA